MKQEEFFRLLDRRLSVIEDGERQDILDEYRQHITMKLREGGVTEEEALADFGDVDDLADEILSAYHVRSGAGATERTAGKAPSVPPKLKAVAGSVRDGVGNFLHRCGGAVSRFRESCRTAFRRLFRREPGGGRPKDTAGGTAVLKRCPARIGAAFGTLLRWIRNIICGGISLLSAAFAACFLMSLCGICVVVTQGYPLAGTAILLLGLFLCATAAAVFFRGLIRRKQKGVSDHA